MVTFVQSHSKKCGVSSISGEINRTSGSSAMGRSKGKDNTIRYMMAQQREMMAGMQDQLEMAEISNHVLLLQDQIRLARGECTRM